MRKDPLVEEAQNFGFGTRTGIDLPGEAPGRIADRKWKLAYYESMKDFYCGIADKPQDADTSDFVYKFAREFCIDGYAYRAGDSVNFAIGQGDTIVTPLQLARAYGAIANGGTLYAPTVAKAIVSPEGQVLRRFAPRRTGTVKVPKKDLDYIDEALKGVTRVGTMAWKMIGFPLDDVVVRSKTGSAEVFGKQSTGWVASYTDDYVVVMMLSQAGTGSGSVGEGVRKIWEALYGVDGEDVNPDSRRDPWHVRPDQAAAVPARRLDHAARGEGVMSDSRRRPTQIRSACTGLDWLLMLAALALVVLGTLLVWSATSSRADLTGGDPNAYLRKQLVNVAIGLVLMVAVMAVDHRWVRILARSPTSAASSAWRSCSPPGPRSTARAPGSRWVACPSSPRSSPSSPSSSAWPSSSPSAPNDDGDAPSAASRWSSCWPSPASRPRSSCSSPTSAPCSS